MFKYKELNGVKYLVDSKGMFIKNEDGENIVAPEGTEEHVAPQVAPEAGDDEETVDELKSYIQSMTKGQVQEAIKSLNLNGSVSDSVKKAMVDIFAKASTSKSDFDVETVKAKLKDVHDGKSKNYEFHMKTLSELNSLTGDVIEADRKEGITRDAVRMPWIEELSSVESTGSDKVTWVEVTNETGAPATTAELATFPAKDFEFAVVSASVTKVAVSSKASNEILEDAPQLVSFVRTSLIDDLNLEVDNLLLTGSGVNELTGVLTVAPAFTGGALAGTIPTPNRFDVLRVALMEIIVAGKGKFRPSAIVLNPTDATALDLEKSATDGHYIMPPFTTADRTVIKGVRILENTGVTAGEFLVGDFSKHHVINRRGLSLQVASENEDDFLKDMITMRLSRRLVNYVRTNEVGAFVKGDFATAITALEL